MPCIFSLNKLITAYSMVLMVHAEFHSYGWYCVIVRQILVLVWNRAILVHEHNVWGLERVLEWQQDLAVVQTLVEVGVRVDLGW
jgi:hypothetical protein